MILPVKPNGVIVLRQVLNDGSFPFSDIPISGSCLCCVDAESEVEK